MTSRNDRNASFDASQSPGPILPGDWDADQVLDDLASTAIALVSTVDSDAITVETTDMNVDNTDNINLNNTNLDMRTINYDPTQHRPPCIPRLYNV